MPDERNSRLEEISHLLRRGIDAAEKERQYGNKSGKSSLSIQDIKRIEAQVAYKYAIENDRWISNIYELGDPFSHGNENTVLFNASEGAVYKSNNLMNSKTILSLFDSVKCHNQLFPATSYEFIGFSGVDINRESPYVEVVFKQTYIPCTDLATFDEIRNYMVDGLGFTKASESSYYYGQLIISDLYPRNILKSKKGNFFVIDDIINQISCC